LAIDIGLMRFDDRPAQLSSAELKCRNHHQATSLRFASSDDQKRELMARTHEVPIEAWNSNTYAEPL